MHELNLFFPPKTKKTNYILQTYAVVKLRALPSGQMRYTDSILLCVAKYAVKFAFSKLVIYLNL